VVAGEDHRFGSESLREGECGATADPVPARMTMRVELGHPGAEEVALVGLVDVDNAASAFAQSGSAVTTLTMSTTFVVDAPPSTRTLDYAVPTASTGSALPGHVAAAARSMYVSFLFGLGHTNTELPTRDTRPGRARSGGRRS
jgi:hypothetical protein